MNKRTTHYIKRVWLNAENSPSTGSIVVFDGELLDHDNSVYRSTFFRLSDCHVSANIHKASYDTDKEFIEKMEIARNTLNDFIEHLKKQYKNETI